MRVIKSIFALATLITSQNFPAIAGESREYKIIDERPVIPLAKSNDLPKKKYIRNTSVGDFGTAHTYPATSKLKVITPSTVETKAITGPLKKR